MSSRITCALDGNDVVVDEHLRVSFHRTIRVPDNHNAYALPPDLGKFPVHRVSNHSHTLPTSMVNKGGMFFPMYQREAMWIKFECSQPYLIEVYVGGVNAVSGAPPMDTFASKLQQIQTFTSTPEKSSRLRKLQDYILVPKQKWIDGFVNADGIVKQFVAMPAGSGYSAEAQITGQEVTGGLQFEVTPLRNFQIFVKTLTGRTRTLIVQNITTVHQVKSLLAQRDGIPAENQRLIYGGKQLEGKDTRRSG